MLHPLHDLTNAAGTVTMYSFIVVHEYVSIAEQNSVVATTDRESLSVQAALQRLIYTVFHCFSHLGPTLGRYTGCPIKSDLHIVLPVFP